MSKTNTVIAVWGSPSCGKTTISAKLANYVSNKGYDTALLLCDTDAPPLPLLISPKEIETEKSLGSILAAAHVTRNLILQNSITLRKNKHISIVGMLKGENRFSYPQYTKTQAEELIEGLREIADFVIIDCSSHLSDDILSTVALIEADSVMRVINCDLKSISYLSSQMPLLADEKFDVNKQIKIANNVKSAHSNENIEQVLGKVTFVIPHSEMVENQYLIGELLRDTPVKRETKEFRKITEDIAEEVFDL
ncbi:MAG: AAA family ATPase [Clostridia bacterium]|nr:AAA family ATPase [Clostridia bacterium]